MPWTVERPSTLFVELACDLYNKTSSAELPQPVGTWGIDDTVWNALIDLTRRKCAALNIPVPSGSLKGLCIWASVVAAKFYVHRFALIDSRVIRVQSGPDHYFVAVRGKAQNGICDITCNQFGGPNYITGSLQDVKGAAQKVMTGGLSLYDAYALGAESKNFVM